MDFLFAILSFISLLPFIFFLKLDITLKGRFILASTSLFVALFGLLAKKNYSFTATGLILLFFILVFTVYFSNRYEKVFTKARKQKVTELKNNPSPTEENLEVHEARVQIIEQVKLVEKQVAAATDQDLDIELFDDFYEVRPAIRVEHVQQLEDEEKLVIEILKDEEEIDIIPIIAPFQEDGSEKMGIPNLDNDADHIPLKEIHSLEKDIVQETKEDFHGKKGKYLSEIELLMENA